MTTAGVLTDPRVRLGAGTAALLVTAARSGFLQMRLRDGELDGIRILRFGGGLAESP